MERSLNALTEEWLSYLRASEDDKAADFYCRQIVPVLAPSLQSTFSKSYGKAPEYDGLVSLLGFTPETVIIAYHFAKPKTLVVLHTLETASYLDQIVTHTRVPAASFFHEPFKEVPSRDIYLALERALLRFPPGARVAIELTGGKKTMGGALAVAAGMLDFDILYIDYSEYMPAFRKPKPESTFVHLVENPMRTTVDLFGGLEVQRALDFFNIGKLETAEELLREAAKRMGNPRAAELCAGLARFYHLWNVFDFTGAECCGQELFEQGLRFHQEVTSKVTFDLHLLKVQLSNIRKLSSLDRMTTLLNFFFTAERYGKNGQHDIAALLYYRTIEDGFSNRLQDLSPKFRRDAADYSLFQLPVDELALRFRKAKARIIKSASAMQDPPEKLALLDTVVLLEALDDDCFKSLNKSRILGLAEVRNHSIFAHGARPLAAGSIDGLKKLAQECVEVYFAKSKREGIAPNRPAFTFMPLHLLGKNERVSERPAE